MLTAPEGPSDEGGTEIRLTDEIAQLCRQRRDTRGRSRERPDRCRRNQTKIAAQESAQSHVADNRLSSRQSGPHQVGSDGQFSERTPGTHDHEPTEERRVSTAGQGLDGIGDPLLHLQSLVLDARDPAGSGLDDAHRGPELTLVGDPSLDGAKVRPVLNAPRRQLHNGGKPDRRASQRRRARR